MKVGGGAGGRRLFRSAGGPVVAAGRACWRGLGALGEAIAHARWNKAPAAESWESIRFDGRGSRRTRAYRSIEPTGGSDVSPGETTRRQRAGVKSEIGLRGLRQHLRGAAGARAGAALIAAIAGAVQLAAPQPAAAAGDWSFSVPRAPTRRTTTSL